MSAETEAALPTIFGLTIEHAYVFAILFGVAFGYWGMNWIEELVEKRRAFVRFQDERKNVEMGRLKSRFFKYLSRAYETWRGDKSDLPKTFDRFADDALFPEWIPVENQELYERSCIEFARPLTPHWKFALDLYTEVENYIKRRTPPTLLTENEADEFHDVRQALSYFWDEAGQNVFYRRKITYRQVLPAIRSDQRVIKFLPYLSVVLHHLNEQKGPGGEYMYMLGAKFYRGVRFSKLPWRP